jgi:hypothetical protein
MSESIEIEALHRSLSSVVSTLNDLIAKQNFSSLIAQEPPRIKKSPDMTYHDFLIKALATRSPV